MRSARSCVCLFPYISLHSRQPGARVTLLQERRVNARSQTIRDLPGNAPSRFVAERRSAECSKQSPAGELTSTQIDARALTKTLASYRDPNLARSIVEILITAAPLALAWTLMWAALSLGYFWLYLAARRSDRRVFSCGFS